MGTPVSKLRELTQRAGRWLGLVETPAKPKHTTAVVSDRFDAMAWRDTYDQAAALRELAGELNERYDHTTDLLADTFLGAYKAAPQVRDRAEMDPSRAVNHQVISTMMNSPEFAELRRETAGDAYAAAMAVLAQGEGLRSMLERAKTAHDQAQQQAQAQQAAAEAAQAVADALAAAEAQADDGAVPEEQATAVQQAIENAQAADAAAAAAAARTDQALAGLVSSLRSDALKAMRQAAEHARDEAALMRAWGIGPGQLERMDFDTRSRLAQRLRGGRLGRFAELIGRFRQMATGERARRVENAPGELVGITLGDDLGRVIPSELAQLGVPALRAVFAAKYAEARLMLYDSVGEQTLGQGAIIACIDCSASMEGSREAWAKACALALLDQARQAKRDFVGILFSSAEQLRTFRFPAGTPYDITTVIEFAEHFFKGGTDFEAPLTAATELLAAEFNTAGRARGDIVLITDGHCHVREEWMREWNDAKAALDFRTFGISIGDRASATAPGSVLDALCDNLRSINDLTDTNTAADLFRII